MSQKIFKIYPPKLQNEIAFMINVGGVPCHVFLEPNGKVMFKTSDFQKINFQSFENAKFAINAIEKLIQEMVEPMIFSKKKRNARSGKKAEK